LGICHIRPWKIDFGYHEGLRPPRKTNEVLFPVSSIKSDSKMGMEMVVGGQAMQMQVELSMEMTLTPGKPGETPK
jgi:hypothetical protein